MRLTLLCHAATVATRASAFPKDEPIDPLDPAKARTIAAALRRVDEAWTGPELRARQTAEALCLDASVEPALRDIDLGVWAGRSFDTVLAAEPDRIAAWTSDPSAAPHGGEAVNELLDRVGPWLETTRLETMRQETKRIVAITHSAVIRAVVALAIDAGARSFWRIDVGPLCRVRLMGDQSRWTLRSIGV